MKYNIYEWKYKFSSSLSHTKSGKHKQKHFVFLFLESFIMQGRIINILKTKLYKKNYMDWNGLNVWRATHFSYIIIYRHKNGTSSSISFWHVFASPELLSVKTKTHYKVFSGILILHRKVNIFLLELTFTSFTYMIWKCENRFSQKYSLRKWNRASKFISVSNCLSR